MGSIALIGFGLRVAIALVAGIVIGHAVGLTAVAVALAALVGHFGLVGGVRAGVGTALAIGAALGGHVVLGLVAVFNFGGCAVALVGSTRAKRGMTIVGRVAGIGAFG